MDFFVSSSSSTENDIREDPNPEFINLDEGANVQLYNQVADIFEHQAGQENDDDNLQGHFLNPHAYENLQDQLVNLNQSNWELKQRCRDIETARRIAKRSIPTRVKDRLIHWKRKVRRVKQKAKAWIIRKCSSNTEVPNVPEFRDSLHNCYYPHDMTFPDIDDQDL